MELLSNNRMFDGEQRVYRHASVCCLCAMQFGVFLPPQAFQTPTRKLPTLFWLSGLTCTEQNFISKAGAQRAAAELGVIIVAPDTSPRGDGVPDALDGAYDMGIGAGFYLNATEQPWSEHYHMYDYVSRELVDAAVKSFPVDADKMGVFGHSMGGHGALTIHLKNPQRFQSVSAFAPIVAPSQVPWGQKALAGYLGEHRETWMDYDACELVARSASSATILIDQGMADEFLQEQLRPELFSDACASAGQSLVMNHREGYDHSYYFMASFMDQHVRHHLTELSR